MGHSLQATALVNEAYIRLLDVQHVSWQNRAHFLAMAARLMRRILVDAARSKRNQKRGGEGIRVTFDERLAVVNEDGHDLVAINDALDALARVDERKSRVIELRFFGGLSVEETAPRSSRNRNEANASAGGFPVATSLVETLAGFVGKVGEEVLAAGAGETGRGALDREPNGR